MKIQIIGCLLLITSTLYLQSAETKQEFLQRLKATEESDEQREMIEKSSFSFSMQELLVNAPSVFFMAYTFTLLCHVNSNSTSSRELDFSRFHMNDLIGLSGMFGIQAVQKLMLNSNVIEKFPPGIFQGLKAITVLDLTNNKIQELKGSNFWGLTHLAVLYLSDNKIHTLHPDAFNGIENLRELYLNGNALTQFPHTIFKSLKKLELLNCSCNQIETVEDDLLHNCIKLIVVSFSGNKFRDIPANFVHGLSNLQLVSFAGNHLTDIPDEIFKDLSIISNKENPIINVTGNQFKQESLQRLKSKSIIGNGKK